MILSEYKLSSYRDMLKKTPKKQSNFNVHLFFDVFIEDAIPGVFLRGDPKRFEIDHKIRSKDSQYRYQTKLDITRYTLISYSEINWKSVTIRLECENKDHDFIYNEIRELFPKATIHKERSTTSKQFFDALEKLSCSEKDWIFFSPNNDHPFIADPKHFYDLIDKLQEVNIEFNNDSLLSIPFSHYTECNNMASIFSAYWGYYGEVYSKIIFENSHFKILKLNKMVTDSVHLYKLKDLKSFFSMDVGKKRVIRIEDTFLYLSNIREHHVIHPKIELCRHYDGYSHIIDYVPPLFIPDGFFENKIKIVYGKTRSSEKCVLINPFSSHYSFEKNSGADLMILLEDLPYFWKKRIEKIEDYFGNLSINKKELRYYKYLHYPKGNNYIINFVKSIIRILKNNLKVIVRGPATNK